MKLNETIKIKDVEITALESFDRTVLLGAHPEPKGDIRGKPELIPDMNQRSLQLRGENAFWNNLRLRRLTFR